MKKNIVMIIMAIVVLLLLPIYVTADDISGNDAEVDDTVSGGNASAVIYYDVRMKKEAAQREYKLYRAQLNAQLMGIRLEYLGSVAAEWAEKCRIEEKKLELGYSTPLTVEEVRNQYEVIQLQIESTKEQQKFYMDMIVLYGGTYQEITVPKEWELLSGDYEESFLASSAQKVYYEQQVETYEVALQTVFSGNEEAIILEKQLQLAYMDLQQYEIDLRLYVRELQLQYEDIGRKLIELDDSISLTEGKITNAEILLEKGQITEMQLVELKNELRGLEYERVCLLYDAEAILYILNYQIENQSI